MIDWTDLKWSEALESSAAASLCCCDEMIWVLESHVVFHSSAARPGRRLCDQRRLWRRRSAEDRKRRHLHAHIFQSVPRLHVSIQSVEPKLEGYLSQYNTHILKQFLRPSFSGFPLQLDRLLPLVLSDHLSSRPLRGHLRLWSVPHQMDPHSQGTYTHTHTHTHIKCGFMYAQTTQKPQTPLWYFNVGSVVVGLLALNCFLKDLFKKFSFPSFTLKMQDSFELNHRRPYLF